MGSQNRASLWPVSLDTGRNTSFVIESEIALRTPCDNPMDASTYCASIREILRAGGPPLDRICRSLPNESRLANLVNLAVARRADNSLTPSWRPIWAWLNPAVEFNPIADATAVQASRGSVDRLMNTSTDLRIFMHSSAASRHEVAVAVPAAIADESPLTLQTKASTQPSRVQPSKRSRRKIAPPL
jgi:hypothetical protein